MAQLRAESSSCVTYRWTYDVFLSFRGEDTRLNFVSHLYDSLHRSGIHAFIDDESLQAGEEIKASLLKAIRESRISIIVFSENYASSTFCLDELAEIVECFKGEGRLVYPVFYYVDPSEVRYQRGSYGESLLYLQKRLETEEYKLQKWRLALSQAANLSGWHLKPGMAKEQEYIRRITCEVSTKINRTPLHVTNYPVGLVPRVQQVMSLLDLWSNKEVNMVGICGIGGLGKSTIARAVYNSIADHFDGLCFLSNVRETSNKHGLSYLQEILLCKLVMEKDLKLGDSYEGISVIAHRLRGRKILLVIDDVDKLEQLQALAGRCDWFGSGSRIIITTRNKHLLACHGIKRIYDVKELNDEEALQVLSWNALKKENADSSYLDISNHVILYSCGLPLALEVIGSNLCGKRIDEWEFAFDKYRRIPNKQVFEVLKLSFDALEDREKEMFLDLACFFKGEKLDVIKTLLSFRGVHPEYIIGALMDKSLVKIEENCVTMHDMIEEMGKEIVRQKSPKEPGKRDRLWFYDDILHVLQENTGSDEIEAIILDLPEDKEVQWSGKAFKHMKNLKMLVIKNASFSRSPECLPNTLSVLEWKGYPSKCLPSNFHPIRLIRLDLSNSSIELLQPLNKKFESLSCLNFRHCKLLRQIPNLSGVSNLMELWLDNCTNLTEIHDSVGFLDKLREFSAMRCKNLRILPTGINLASLEHLNLYGCLSLRRFPEILDEMRKIRTIDLDKTAIEELPSSICNLIGLESLNMDECHNLKQLPVVICMMPHLWKITANFCEELRHFKMRESEREVRLQCSAMSMKLEHVCFSNCNLSNGSLDFCLSYFPNLIQLDLSYNNFTTLPASIKECHCLKYLSLDNCNMLQHIEGMPQKLEKFSALHCTLLSEPSRSMLLNQEIHQYPGKRNFILPGKNIPEWLDKYSCGDSLSFWVRNELPNIYMWILVKDDQVSLCDCKFSVRVNDIVQEISSGWFSLSTMKRYHIYLSDLQSIVRKLQLSLMDKWNHVNISIENRTQEVRSKREVYFAVHVYKQGNNVENIEFMNPKACINYYPWKLIQQPEDLEQLKDDVNQDSKSTNYAELAHNSTTYQDISPNFCGISKLSERKDGRDSLIRSKHNAILRKIRRWKEDHSMILKLKDLTNMVVAANQLIESLENILHLNIEEQGYSFVLMDLKILADKARLKDEFKQFLAQNRHPFDHKSTPFQSSELKDTTGEGSFSKASEKHILDLVRPELLQHIKCIASLMFVLDYSQECYNAYTNVRRHALNECLLHLERERLSIENVSKREWDSLNSKIKGWIYQVKIFVRLYITSEKWLSEQIFGDNEASLICFVGASKALIFWFLEFCEAISVGPHNPERIFRFLDMYQVLADLIPDLDALYSGEVGSSVRIKCEVVLNRLGACVGSIFLEFKNVIASNPSQSPFPGGGIHPLTYYVMSYISYLLDYNNTLNILNGEEELEYDISLYHSMSHDTSQDSDILGSSYSSVSSVTVHFRSVTSILELKLENKSKLYKEAACQHLFLMNNMHYMAQRVQESQLKHIFGDEWIRKHVYKYQQHAWNYEQASWSSVLSLLKDERIQLSMSRNLLKTRLQNFYVAFKDIYRIQTAWVIPDHLLREGMQISISQKLVHAYQAFLRKYYNYIGDKHIKYNVCDIETSILGFFGGSHKSWPHSKSFAC
ncbi:TMV resistance protein N-like [Neltuma alba]|uniref:TMV resistance protein N-like n=1 Tax=Neltuma alba TaxID=207710 RepID=UPI0010A2F01C|nr:TMV resistance protein N-like [Prosopis alba]